MIYCKITDPDIIQPRERVTALEGTACVLRCKVRYVLYCNQIGDTTIYDFGVSYFNESVECSVICDRATANKIFFAILQGRVTPCSAVYIIKELAEESDNCVFVER